MEKYRFMAIGAAIFVTIFAEFFFPFLVPKVIYFNEYHSIYR